MSIGVTTRTTLAVTVRLGLTLGVVSGVLAAVETTWAMIVAWPSPAALWASWLSFFFVIDTLGSVSAAAVLWALGRDRFRLAVAMTGALLVTDVAGPVAIKVLDLPRGTDSGPWDWSPVAALAWPVAMLAYLLIAGSDGVRRARAGAGSRGMWLVAVPLTVIGVGLHVVEDHWLVSGLIGTGVILVAGGLYGLTGLWRRLDGPPWFSVTLLLVVPALPAYALGLTHPVFSPARNIGGAVVAGVVAASLTALVALQVRHSRLAWAASSDAPGEPAGADVDRDNGELSPDGLVPAVLASTGHGTVERGGRDDH
jgi:hypothetical protein